MADPQRLVFRALLAVYRVVGMVDYLSGGICDALLSPRTRSNDPEAVALVLDGLRAMDRRALANAMVSISLKRPDLTPRLGVDPLPDHVRHGLRPPGVERRPGGGVRAGCSSMVRWPSSPDTAYLTPLEAPEATIRHVRNLWAQ